MMSATCCQVSAKVHDIFDERVDRRLRRQVAAPHDDFLDRLLPGVRMDCPHDRLTGNAFFTELFTAGTETVGVDQKRHHGLNTWVKEGGTAQHLKHAVLSANDAQYGTVFYAETHLKISKIFKTETNSNTAARAMAELLRNPRMMVKVKEEIERVTEPGKVVESSDIEKLHYLQAVIKESFRLHPTAAFLLPRRPERTVDVGDQ
ncbi:putative cytochrome P450 [Dioscorea sansibarensis]